VNTPRHFVGLSTSCLRLQFNYYYYWCRL